MIVHGNDVKPVAAEPGVTRRLLSYNESLMMCEIHFDRGARGSMHAHPHQQITYVARGSLVFYLGDEKKLVSQGDSVLIEANVTHGVEALEPSVLVDVFSPMRREFI